MMNGAMLTTNAARGSMPVTVMNCTQPHAYEHRSKITAKEASRMVAANLPSGSFQRDDRSATRAVPTPKPIRNPPVGPMMAPRPPVIPENTGTPIAPMIR